MSSGSHTQRVPSGRFVLRISPGLHAALRAAAGDEGLSLNDYCARKLAAPVGRLASFGGAMSAVERAAAFFAGELIGVVAFGSWARDEMADGSDIDLLVVLEAGTALTRELYRRWDEEPIEWGGRPVEPHFVRLPAAGEPPGGIWPEVALDGIVLFERGLRLSAHLVRVRRLIASGRLVRRFVHGQPYWAQVA
jgi:hypothetical protein